MLGDARECSKTLDDAQRCLELCSAMSPEQKEAVVNTVSASFEPRGPIFQNKVLGGGQFKFERKLGF